MTSFAPVLAGLGLRLLVIEDPELMARLSWLPPRQAQYVRPGMRGGSVQISLTASFMQRIRKKGGENPASIWANAWSNSSHERQQTRAGGAIVLFNAAVA